MEPTRTASFDEQMYKELLKNSRKVFNESNIQDNSLILMALKTAEKFYLLEDIAQAKTHDITKSDFGFNEPIL